MKILVVKDEDKNIVGVCKKEDFSAVLFMKMVAEHFNGIISVEKEYSDINPDKYSTKIPIQVKSDSEEFTSIIEIERSFLYLP